MNSDLKKSSPLKNPEMCIIAGPNGSGKTTITKLLLHYIWGETSHYINPDDVAKEMFGDWNNPDSVLKCRTDCKIIR